MLISESKSERQIIIKPPPPSEILVTALTRILQYWEIPYECILVTQQLDNVHYTYEYLKNVELR